MAIRRTKRIDLRSYDATWQDSFITVTTKSYREMQDFRKVISGLEAKIVKSEREEKKLEKKIEKANSEELDALYTELDSQKALQEEQSEKLIEKLLQIISSSFVNGQIFDFDEKKQRELKKEELQDFDSEIIKALSQDIMGTSEKKA